MNACRGCGRPWDGTPDDARWFAIRKLVELDDFTPDRAHTHVCSIAIPDGCGWEAYQAARRALVELP